MTSPPSFADFHIYFRDVNPRVPGAQRYELACSGFTGQVMFAKPVAIVDNLECAAEVLLLIADLRTNYPNCFLEVDAQIEKMMHIPPELLRPEGR